MRAAAKPFHLLIAGVMGTLFNCAALAGNSVAAADKYDLQEIVVTAEKRSSTVQKTSISMTAISGQDLQDRGISAVEEALQEVPGVSFSSGGPGQTQFEIRGLSQNGGESPTVGFYLDETPVTPPALSSNGKVSIDPDLYDLSRIEVLRGPQGTLYGAGAMGGTIKLVTNPPDPSHLYATGESILSGTQGGGVNYRQNAMVNLPMADGKVAVRLVGTQSHTSGWIDRIVVSDFPLETNPTGNGYYGNTRGNVASIPPTKIYRNVNDENLTSGRASVLLRPMDELSITAAVFYQRIKQGGPNAYDSPPDALAHYQPSDLAEPYSDQFTVSSLTINYDLSWMKITSATSYLSRETHLTQDNSEQTQNFLNLGAFPITSGGFGAVQSGETDPTRQFSQEVRVASNGDGSLQWLTGLFYSSYNAVQNLYSKSDAVLGVSGGASDYLFQFYAPTQIVQRAWFGNASYQASDQIKLTAGLRYFSYSQSEHTAGSGLYYTGSLATSYASGSASDKGINPMATLSYSPSDDVMIYTTAAKGFREGAGNIPVPTGTSGQPLQCLQNLEALGRTSAPLTYGPDTVWSYEIGAKSKVLDQRLTLNGDIYYLKWSKVQQPVALACGISFTDNAADAAVKGGEIEALLKVNSHLRLIQNIGFAHAAFTRDSVESGIVAGQRLLDVPEWTISTAIEYRTSVNGNDEVSGRLSNSYVSSSNEITYGLDHLPPRDLTALRFMYKHKDLSATLFVDNLRNTRVVYQYLPSVSFTSPGFERIATSQPRTIGIDLNYGF
jgi:outer membrane receptor protein involved in Fe transport